MNLLVKAEKGYEYRKMADDRLAWYIGAQLAAIFQNHSEPSVEYKYPYSIHNNDGKTEKRFLEKEPPS